MSRPLVLPACLTVATALAATATAATQFRGDFETGDLKPWGFVGPQNIAVTTEAVRAGSFGARVRLSGAEARGEMIRGFDAVSGAEVYVGLSLLVPLVDGAHQGGVAFFETSGVPSLSLKATTLRADAPVTRDVGTMSPGVWHDIVFRVVWGDASVGEFELWFDGKLVVPTQKVATIRGGAAKTYYAFHLGLSNWPRRPSTDTETLFVDEVRVGTTAADVMPPPGAHAIVPTNGGPPGEDGSRPVVSAADGGLHGAPDAPVTLRPAARDASFPPSGDDAASAVPVPAAGTSVDAGTQPRSSSGCSLAPRPAPSPLVLPTGAALALAMSRRRARSRAFARSKRLHARPSETS